MFVWRNSFNKDISRMAVDGMPSSSASSRILFRAIICPVTRSFALYTIPYVPSPIFSSFWYRSMIYLRNTKKILNAQGQSTCRLRAAAATHRIQNYTHLLLAPAGGGRAKNKLFTVVPSLNVQARNIKVRFVIQYNFNLLTFFFEFSKFENINFWTKSLKNLFCYKQFSWILCLPSETVL